MLIGFGCVPRTINETPLPAAVPLRFATPGATLERPAVHATVNGQAAYLIVDTGADAHALSREFVERAGWPVRRYQYEGPDRAERADHNLITLVEDATLVLEGGWTAPQQTFAVIDVPELYQAEIAGILSPQLLAREAAPVLLDLPRAIMTLIDPAAARAQERSGVRLGARGTSESCAPTQDFPSRSYAGVAGSVRIGDSPLATPVTLKPDTGRRTTVIFGNRSSVRLSDPAVADAREVWVSLVLGDVAMEGTVEVYTGRRLSPCPLYDGLLGMDVLGACRLVLGRKSMFARCDE